MPLYHGPGQSCRRRRFQMPAARLGGRFDFLDEPGLADVLRLSQTLSWADELVGRHTKIEAARQAEQRAEEQRRKAEAKAVEAARLQAEQ